MYFSLKLCFPLFPLHLIEPMAQHPLNLLYYISQAVGRDENPLEVFSQSLQVTQSHTHPSLRILMPLGSLDPQRTGGEPRLPNPQILHSFKQPLQNQNPEISESRNAWQGNFHESLQCVNEIGKEVLKSSS